MINAETRAPAYSCETGRDMRLYTIAMTGGIGSPSACPPEAFVKSAIGLIRVGIERALPGHHQDYHHRIAVCHGWVCPVHRYRSYRSNGEDKEGTRSPLTTTLLSDLVLIPPVLCRT